MNILCCLGITQNKYISLKKIFVNNKRQKLSGKLVKLPLSQNKSIGTDDDFVTQQSNTINYENIHKTTILKKFKRKDNPKDTQIKQTSNTICKSLIQ